MVSNTIPWEEVKSNPLMATNKLLDFVLHSINIEMCSVARLVQKSKRYGEQNPEQAN
jgi:hypothetical protein